MNIINAINETKKAHTDAGQRVVLVQFLARYANPETGLSNYRCCTPLAPVIQTFLQALEFTESDVTFEVSALEPTITTVAWVDIENNAKLKTLCETIANTNITSFYKHIVRDEDSLEFTGYQESQAITPDHWGMRLLQITRSTSCVTEAVPDNCEPIPSPEQVENAYATAIGLNTVDRKATRIFPGPCSSSYYGSIFRFLYPSEDNMMCLTMLTESLPRLALGARNRMDSPLLGYFVSTYHDAEAMLHVTTDTKDAIACSVTHIHVDRYNVETVKSMLLDPVKLWRYVEEVYNTVYKGMHVRVLPGSRVSILNHNIPPCAPAAHGATTIDVEDCSDEYSNYIENLDLELTDAIVVYLVLGFSSEERSFDAVSLAEHVLTDLHIKEKLTTEALTKYVKDREYNTNALDEYESAAKQWFALTHIDNADEFFRGAPLSEVREDIEEVEDIIDESRNPECGTRRSIKNFNDKFNSLTDEELANLTSVEKNPCLDIHPTAPFALPTTFTVGACNIFTKSLPVGLNSYAFRKGADGTNLNADRVVTHVFSGVHWKGCESSHIFDLPRESVTPQMVTDWCDAFCINPKTMLESDDRITDKTSFGYVVLETNIKHSELAKVLANDVKSIIDTAKIAFSQTILSGRRDPTSGYLKLQEQTPREWYNALARGDAELHLENSQRILLHDKMHVGALGGIIGGFSLVRNSVQIHIYEDKFGRSVIVYRVPWYAMRIALTIFRCTARIPVATKQMRDVAYEVLRKAVLEPQALVDHHFKCSNCDCSDRVAFIAAYAALQYRMVVEDEHHETFMRIEDQHIAEELALRLITIKPTFTYEFVTRFGSGIESDVLNRDVYRNAWSSNYTRSVLFT